MIDTPTLAYIAGVLDLHGVIRTRTAGDTELPYVALSGSNEGMLTFLADVTGTRAVVTRRQFSRAGCAEHCSEKHQHVTSVSGRWSVSGVKATVLLWNVRPFMRLQAEEATSALAVGMSTKYKPATVRKMAELGWDVPEFDAGNVVRMEQDATTGRWKKASG